MNSRPEDEAVRDMKLAFGLFGVCLLVALIVTIIA